jgi:hypothetical protein
MKPRALSALERAQNSPGIDPGLVQIPNANHLATAATLVGGFGRESDPVKNS